MKIYYFSSTHWDREWYQSFQGFRKRLAETAEGICDLLEGDPDFGAFHFDGQTVVLEDAAELRPDLAPRLRRLVASRRLLVGPWYVMPDEFLVSGEALVRNLLAGRALARRWGAEPWSFGYVCDVFGHIAQLPQILAGFGIRVALVGRGTNESTTEHFFLWESPDGTSCLRGEALRLHGLRAISTCRSSASGTTKLGRSNSRGRRRPTSTGRRSRLRSRSSS